MHSHIPPPNTQILLTPLLSALRAAAVSPTPPKSILPYLSPILRQRVQLLSATSSSTEPWLPLLCYDTNPNKIKRLAEIAGFHEALEAHPVSGEVELDWEEGVAVLFKRVDEETLQAAVEFAELGLWIRLIWCTGDAQGEGGPDGWRIGEVSVMPDAGDVVSGKRDMSGWSSIGEAEGQWRGEAVRDAARKSSDAINGIGNGTSANGTNGSGKPHVQEEEEEDDDDDDYWAQYDYTPSRTPAPKRSPAPQSMTSHSNGAGNGNTDEDAYYAQYASVQPAMDNHDPDEADQDGTIESTLEGTSTQSILHNQLDSHPEFSESSQAWEEHHSLQNNIIPQPLSYTSDNLSSTTEHLEHLEHPRPASSPSSSNGSITVLELERKAAGQESNEMAVRQHISSTLKSLWRLSRGMGMEMEEFRRVVGMEVDFLGMLEDQEEG